MCKAVANTCIFSASSCRTPVHDAERSRSATATCGRYSAGLFHSGFCIAVTEEPFTDQKAASYHWDVPADILLAQGSKGAEQHDVSQDAAWSLVEGWCAHALGVA